MKHHLQLGFIVDGVNKNGSRIYMGVRYCEQCKHAAPAIGLRTTYDESLPLVRRDEYKLVTNAELGDDCHGKGDAND